MKPDPAAPYIPLYFIGWAFLAIFIWLWIRSRPTPQEKKLWSDRMSIILGVFVTGFICFILMLWKQYSGIPIFVAFGALIVYLNVRNTFYCESCGKRSTSHNWFTRSFHCPHCGHKLQ
jgi:hypothetical protein